MNLRVLHLEEAREDAERVRAALDAAGLRCEVVVVGGEPAFRAGLDLEIDLVLADYAAPGLDGLRALELALVRRPDVPFVFVSRAVEADLAVETLRRGATDFVVKHRLERLATAVPRALRELQVRVERARAQEESARIYAQLEDAVRARDEMMAVVSHDLRNPLNAILVSAARLQTATSPERLLKLADIIARSANRMNRMIGDLLDITRLARNVLSLEPQVFEIGDAIAESLELHLPLAARKSLVLGAGEVAAGLVVHADRERVLQILSNLIENAIRFTPAGGSITVSARLDGDEVLVSTADTGPGIAPAHLERVFDRFWRAAPGDKTSIGLGLSIVKGLVEAQGGRVSVTSTLGHGATLSFTLPAMIRGPRP